MELKKKILKPIGKVIRKHRKSKGLTQEELAFLAGLSETFAGEVERGEKLLGTENLIRILVALDLENKIDFGDPELKQIFSELKQEMEGKKEFLKKRKKK